MTTTAKCACKVESVGLAYSTLVVHCPLHAAAEEMRAALAALDVAATDYKALIDQGRWEPMQGIRVGAALRDAQKQARAALAKASGESAKAEGKA